MKKVICFLLVMLLVPLTALADVAWEPANSFYKLHYDQCKAEERSYWVNGEAGYVTLRQEPEGKPLANIKNGTVRYVYGTYNLNGKLWGLVGFSAGYEGDIYLSKAHDLGDDYREAWVLMDEMVLKYDHREFMSEFGHEVDETARRRVDCEAALFYDYPGGTVRYEKAQTLFDSVEIWEIYIDPQGREWGYINYWRGTRDIWICIDDPENPDLQYADHMPELYPTPEGVGTDLPAWNIWRSTAFRWTVAGVAVVCIVTVARIAYLKKKREG